MKVLRINLESIVARTYKRLYLGLKYKWNLLHIVCVCALCKSVGNGRVHREMRYALLESKGG